MRKTILAWIAVLALVLAGCGNDDGNTEKVQEDTQVNGQGDGSLGTDTMADATLPICPDEVLLDGLLPCNCYGTVATDPDAQVPGCITQVVCCPTVQGLRCEDHELLKDTTPEIGEDISVDVAAVDTVEQVDTAIEETLAEVVEVPVCPNEVELSTHTPCTCKGTLVEDVTVAMPDCTKKVVCCPFDGLKCE